MHFYEWLISLPHSEFKWISSFRGICNGEIINGINSKFCYRESSMSFSLKHQFSTDSGQHSVYCVVDCFYFSFLLVWAPSCLWIDVDFNCRTYWNAFVISYKNSIFSFVQCIPFDGYGGAALVESAYLDSLGIQRISISFHLPSLIIEIWNNDYRICFIHFVWGIMEHVSAKYALAIWKVCTIM